MKNLKRLSGAIVLALSLSVCAWAGQMDSPPAPPPPPPGPECVSTTPGDLGTTSETVSEVSLTGFAVGMLESILPLL